MVGLPMNSNNYQLGSSDKLLNLKAERLMENITFLANERVYANRFPTYSTIDYNGVDEEELIESIINLETVYAEADKLHHKSHLYLIDSDCRIYHNNTEYGTDINNSAPITGGRNPLDALINAWKYWSIPPVLVLNADYYVPGVDITRILCEVGE